MIANIFIADTQRLKPFMEEISSPGHKAGNDIFAVFC
jgi:hypothetical protein